MKIKTNILQYKDPTTGEYIPIPVVASTSGGSSGGEVDILPQADYEFATYEGMMVYQEPLPNGVHLQLGQTYKVLWDNVEYTCTTVGESSGTSYEVMMGNLAMGGLENTGEPFAIANVYDTSDGVNTTFIIMAVDGGTSHNLRIYQSDLFVTESQVRTIVDEIINEALHSGV